MAKVASAVPIKMQRVSRRLERWRSSRQPLCLRLQSRPANSTNVKPRHAGICCPAGLGHCHAGQRDRFRSLGEGTAGKVAGGRTAPRDRRGVGLAVGPLGLVSGRPRGDTPGTQPSRGRFRAAHRSAGPGHAGRTSHGSKVGRVRTKSCGSESGPGLAHAR